MSSVGGSSPSSPQTGSKYSGSLLGGTTFASSNPFTIHHNAYTTIPTITTAVGGYSAIAGGTSNICMSAKDVFSTNGKLQGSGY